MKKTVKTLASVMSAVLLLSVCSCNKSDSKKAVDPVIGVMEDAVGKNVADAEKMFEEYFGIELEGTPGAGSGGNPPLQSYYYDSTLTKDGITFTSLVFMVVTTDDTVQQVQLTCDNLDDGKKEYDTSSEKKREIKSLCKAMNNAVQDKAGKPVNNEPLFEGSKESYLNRYKTDKFVYIVSVRDLTEMPEDKGSSDLVDTNILIYQAQ